VALQLPEAGVSGPITVRGFLCRRSLRDERLVLHLEAVRRDDDESGTRPD
jgi:hypothetical protein